MWEEKIIHLQYRGERRFATNEFFIYFDGQSRFHREHLSDAFFLSFLSRGEGRGVAGTYRQASVCLRQIYWQIQKRIKVGDGAAVCSVAVPDQLYIYIWISYYLGQCNPPHTIEIEIPSFSGQKCQQIIGNFQQYNLVLK